MFVDCLIELPVGPIAWGSPIQTPAWGREGRREGGRVGDRTACAKVLVYSSAYRDFTWKLCITDGLRCTKNNALFSTARQALRQS